MMQPQRGTISLDLELGGFFEFFSGESKDVVLSGEVVDSRLAAKISHGGEMSWLSS